MSTATAFYDRFWDRRQVAHQDPLTQRRVDIFLKVVPPNSKVLDLGCGNGRGSNLLVSSGMRVLGVDVSYDALRKARELDGTFPTVQGICDAALPFRRESFDVVYCTEVIEHVMDPQVLVRECFRVLRPSGTLFVSAPYHGRFKNILLASLAFEKHFDVVGGHVRFFTLRSLAAVLQAAGFHVERTWRLGRFWLVWNDMVFLARKPAEAVA